MIKENQKEDDQRSQKEDNQSKQKNKSEFFNMLEDKVFSFGKKILKDGLVNIAMAQIHNTEEKIKSELEHKYKEYQSRALQGVFLLLGAVFLVYGLLSLLFMQLGISE
jgi:hypothetical protein